MTTRTLKLALAALAFSTATMAHAGVSEDFAGCDGLKKPKSSDDGMRGEASIAPYQRGRNEIATVILASCDRALAAKELRAEQTLRKAHLLRARAAAKMEMGKTAEALVDIDAAEASATSYKGDFFYDRSMGASLLLLRALAQHEQGNGAEAVRLAEQAVAARPYAIQVQRVASIIRSANSGQPVQSKEVWQTLQQLDPSSRTVVVSEPGKPTDFASLAASATEPDLKLPPPPSIQAVLSGGGDATSLFASWDAPIRAAMITAYAEAATGKNDAARARVAQVRGELLRAKEEKSDVAGMAAIMADLVGKGALDPMATLVEARVAVNEGRLADVASALAGKEYFQGPVTSDLYAAYAAAATKGGTAAPELPKLGEPAVPPKPRFAALASEILMRPESARKMIDYQQSRPNILGALIGGALTMGTSLLGGIDRTAGFAATDKGNGAWSVEYTGNTTSGPVVQEMTLLRAAEIAKEKGKSHFEIFGRNDYQRYLTSSQYGVEMSRVVTGYKTVLDVRLLDQASAPAHAFDALAVIDALGPVYYEEKKGG